MLDFNIQYGRSSELFIDGKINPNLIIEEGSWYLCIDTAELFIGVITESGPTLKRINDAKINEIPVESLVLKDDLDSAKQEVIQTVIPEVTEVKTKVETVLIPKVEEELAPTITELKTWVENKEYLQDIDLDGYATETYVDNKVAEIIIPDVSGFATKRELTDAITSIEHPTTDLTNYVTKDELEGFIAEIPSEYITEEELDAKGYLTAHQDISHLATKDEIPDVSKYAKITEVYSAITEAVKEKADEVLFTTNKIVNNAIGGFTAGESLNGLTVTELFIKLLNLTDDPNEPGLPDEPNSIISYIILNKLPMYQLVADGQLIALTYDDVLHIDFDDQTKPTQSGFYKVYDTSGAAVEFGYQQIQKRVPDVPYMIALPSIINYNEHVSVKVYDAITSSWKSTRLTMTSDRAQIIDICDSEGCEIPVTPEGYTLWVSTANVYSSSAIYRFIITEEV